jgi:hypothetical protein
MHLNETYNKVHTGQHFVRYISYSEQSETRRYFVVIYFKHWLDLNGRHQFVIYANDINFLGENTNTIERTQKPVRLGLSGNTRWKEVHVYISLWKCWTVS